MNMFRSIAVGFLSTALMGSTALAAEVFYEVTRADGSVKEHGSLQIDTTSRLKQLNNAFDAFDFAVEAPNNKIRGDRLDQGCNALFAVLKGGRGDLLPIERDRSGLKLTGEREIGERLKIGGVDGAIFKVCYWGPNDNAAMTPAGGYTNHEYCNTFSVTDNDQNGAKHREGVCF